MLYVLTSIIDHRVRSAENIANDSSAEYEKKIDHFKRSKQKIKIVSRS
jgi:hypothetical protein